MKFVTVCKECSGPVIGKPLKAKFCCRSCYLAWASAYWKGEKNAEICSNTNTESDKLNARICQGQLVSLGNNAYMNRRFLR